MAADLSVVMYDVTAAEIAATKAQYAALTCDTPDGYELVRKAIGTVRDTRVRIEKRRVELKADALAYGRRVDGAAKELTDLILEIEEPLKAKKLAVDDEKDRVRREAEDRVKREMEAEAQAKRDAEEAARRAAHEAEAAKLAEERERQRVERAALDAERERIAAEQRAADMERRKADDAARKVREAEERRIAAERAELDKQKAVEAAKREAAEQVERERIAAEEARVAQAEREAKIAKLLPVADSIRAYADKVLLVPVPDQVPVGPVRKRLGEIVKEARKQLKALADDFARGAVE